MQINRVIIIVMDSVGIGELPDATEYGDKGSNTLGNISRVCGQIDIPNMCELGLGKIDGVNYLNVPDKITGCYGRMAEASHGKDTVTGHWEITGIQLDKAFPVYPNGFPNEIITKFKIAIGTDILGNFAASGTEIIKNLGEAHIKTSFPIVYTSADSVFQIAAHEEIIPLEKLYDMCIKAREILSGEHAVGRVVARPFTGSVGNFMRTTNRRDFCLTPVRPTVLDAIKEKDMEVIAVGKIEDIFSGRGITHAIHTESNMHGVDVTLEYMKEASKGLIFTNLVDFDMLYGHRNNSAGYKNALEEFDGRIPEILASMKEDDILILTADHGCDPVTPSTDHSREYVPIMLYGKQIRQGVNLGTRSSFSDIACTITEIFNLGSKYPGTSFLSLLV